MFPWGLGEAISRLEGMAMTNATTVAKFEKSLNTKLEEMMGEILQVTLTAGETKEAIANVVSQDHLRSGSVGL